MITTEFLSSLDRFNLMVRKRVTSKYAGGRRSIMVGRGITLTDRREYAPGDDIRLIDWRLFARTDDLYVKRYEEERNVTTHILLDCSASMNFGRPSKFDYAAMLAAGFAYLSLHENEKFQFATFSDSMEVFQPGRGAGHLASLVDHLNHLKVKGSSKMKDAISAYKKFLGTKSLVILVSDFLLNFEEVEEALLSLSRNELKVVQVLDDEELRLSVEGDMKLRDMESDETLRTYVSPRLKAEYDAALRSHTSQIEKVCNGFNADFYTLSTSTPVFDSFYRMLGSR